MKKLACFLGLLVVCQCVVAQDSIITRVVLVGDGGQFTMGRHPVAEAIKKMVPLDAKTVVIFLGDNVYKVGLPDETVITYSETRSVLDSQLSIVANTKARLYMIPGNHDWNNGQSTGFETIMREQSYVNIIGNQNVRFYPENGCGGPVEVELDSVTVLVVIDSQWWIHPYDKPGIESDCPFKTTDEVLLQLEDILNRNFGKLVILATHHPFKSNGVHGGFFGLKQHLFPFTELKKNLYIPLPILGSIYPIARSVFGTPQDLKHPVYTNMVNDIEKVAKTHPNLIFVAGHEHNLQLLKDSNYHYFVSGSGSKTTRVNKSRKSLFVAEEQGFATLEISKSRNVRASFYTVSDSTRKPYSENIMNFSKLPVLEEFSTTPKEDAEFKDTVYVAASEKYSNPSIFQRVSIGNNYRKEWSTLVNMRVFHLNKEKGGLKITGLGGGKQTKSLKLDDKNGGQWTLRTIDKDPEKALPENFRNTLGAEVVQDLVSTAHPYSGLVIPDLAKVNGVTVATPEFFFVPDDPALGFYRPLFANTVCMLESRDPTVDATETKSTGKLLEKMVSDNDHRADQNAVLRARLLDMLVADWDRHFDQWRWGTRDTGKGRLYYPIPKDRDQAMANSDGLLIKFVSDNKLPFLKGFKNTIPRIEWLNWTARDFDRAFMNQLSGKEWNETIAKFQQNLTDSVIAIAVSKFPPEIYEMDAEIITSKLKSRRDLLLTEGMKYYRFLSKYVNIVGSNKPEYFKISSEPDGNLKIQVYERINQTDTGYRLYQRVFDHSDTKEIRLYGLNGNDLFDVDENTKSRIQLRIIGGKGNDTFDIKGNVRSVLYDMKDSSNYILNKNHTRVFFSNLPSVNAFRWVENQYSNSRFPRTNIAYNTDDGFFIGAGYWRRTHGFRKIPFASENRVSASYAFRGAFKLRYQGEFNQVFRATDILVKSEYISPTLNNFFGLGNNTAIDKSRNIRYYMARYKYIETSVLFRKKPFQLLSLLAGPTYFRYWNDPKDNIEKILGRPSLISLDSLEVYSTKSYLGGKVAAEVYNLNSELFPTRGMQWHTEFSHLIGMSGRSGPVTKLTSDMTVYASLSSPASVVTVLRLGGGHIFNKHFEYFQALNLGANNFLRGFRKNRFSGSSLAYGSLEMRVKIFTSVWSVLPGDVGIIGFGDAGRVWMEGESSRRWHTALGGGLYYVPFNMVLVSASLAYSKEETLFNFSVGTKINLTF
ncbi:MAG: BamA/TamA family outer membrane protein [Chitinophagaceae bacterium]|nr:BamA/TamA family outer membrane protein [Chitinophagaceae bacterium]